MEPQPKATVKFDAPNITAVRRQIQKLLQIGAKDTGYEPSTLEVRANIPCGKSVCGGQVFSDAGYVDVTLCGSSNCPEKT